MSEASPAAYLALHASGELGARAARARARLRRCALCPRCCRVDRLAGELGECRTGALARVASAGPHFGEEAPLVGRGGSGTIFFAGCNLACVFCQNHDISRPAGDPPPMGTRGGRAGPPPPDAGVRGARPGPRAGRSLRWELGPEGLAQTMLELQHLGCENVNLVSPSHVVPQILEALAIAAARGLRLPLVYNTGGYDSLATLRLLDGVVDIYMPDMKHADDEVGLHLSGVPDYVARNRAAVREMHRQVGDLEVDERGVARRGLLVRHLVLPGGLAGTAEVARFLAEEISPATYVNVMDQYRPAHRVAATERSRSGLLGSDAGDARYSELGRPLAAAEFRAALAAARDAGLRRLDGYL